MVAHWPKSSEERTYAAYRAIKPVFTSFSSLPKTSLFRTENNECMHVAQSGIMMERTTGRNHNATINWSLLFLTRITLFFDVKNLPALFAIIKQQRNWYTLAKLISIGKQPKTRRYSYLLRGCNLIFASGAKFYTRNINDAAVRLSWAPRSWTKFLILQGSHQFRDRNR